MMTGIFLGGKYLKNTACVDFFLKLSGNRYNYIYDMDGLSSTKLKVCEVEPETPGMYHAVPNKLVSWEW